MYKMKPEYYIGIAHIDQEHARLFELAQETYDLLNDNLLHDKAEKLTSLISQLIDYTKTHFAHEEAYLESIHYAHIPAPQVRGRLDGIRSGFYGRGLGNTERSCGKAP